MKEEDRVGCADAGTARNDGDDPKMFRKRGTATWRPAWFLASISRTQRPSSPSMFFATRSAEYYMSEVVPPDERAMSCGDMEVSRSAPESSPTQRRQSSGSLSISWLLVEKIAKVRTSTPGFQLWSEPKATVMQQR